MSLFFAICVPATLLQWNMFQIVGLFCNVMSRKPTDVSVTSFLLLKKIFYKIETLWIIQIDHMHPVSEKTSCFSDLNVIFNVFRDTYTLHLLCFSANEVTEDDISLMAGH